MIAFLRLSGRRFLAASLSIAMLFLVFPVLPAVGYNVLDEEITTEPVASGVNLLTFLQETSEGPLNVYVLRVDLGNPYVQVDALIGADGATFAKAATVLNKAQREGAVAAINGDFFDLKEGRHPLGFTVDAGELLTSPMLRDDYYSLAFTGDTQPYIDVFNFMGSLEAENGEVFPLSGVNKVNYNLEAGGQSVAAYKDSLHLFSPAWGSASRGTPANLPGWVEVVVDQGIVQEVRVNQPATAIPGDGYVLAGHGSAADFLLTNCLVGSIVKVSYETAPLNEEILTAVGGQALLVAEGKQLEKFSREVAGKVARSAAGFTKDGKKLYLAVVEGGSASRGMNQTELADFLVERLGLWRAINLDGGGSSTLVARPLGEETPELVNKPAQGVQRLLPTALGIFSTAPAGSLDGLVINGPVKVIAGQEYEFSAKGYDQYYNPYSLSSEEIAWSVKEGESSFTGSCLKVAGEGRMVIEASCRGVSQTKEIAVVGLAALEVAPSVIQVEPGETAALKVTARSKDGQAWELPAGAVSFKLDEGLGEVREGVFTAADKDVKGTLRVNYLDLLAEVPVTVGMPLPPDVEKHWSAPAVRELLKRGIITGYADGSFRPRQEVTRAEFIKLLAGALEWEAPEDVRLPFKDKIQDWALPTVKAAWSKGIIGGYPDGTFRPNNTLTRTEMAVFISRALELTEPCEQAVFSDYGTIPRWARTSVDQTAAAGIIQGGGGLFRPQAATTRGETATLLSRII